MAYMDPKCILHPDLKKRKPWSRAPHILTSLSLSLYFANFGVSTRAMDPFMAMRAQCD
jgi:hypothetical protein